VTLAFGQLDDERVDERRARQRRRDDEGQRIGRGRRVAPADVVPELARQPRPPLAAAVPLDQQRQSPAIEPQAGDVVESDAGAGKGELFELTRVGSVLRRIALPGARQEGVALDDRGSLYIAQDSGGVLRIDAAPRP
jgi:hypothetical protein